MTLALHRDEFYDVAAGDLTLLQEVVRALAERLRALVAERPEEARVGIGGAIFVRPTVGELLHAATVAVVGEIPLERLWHAVPAYPTISEIWLRLLEACGL